MLVIGREKRYQVYDLQIEKPRPLIPGRLIGEVTERVLADGSGGVASAEAMERHPVRMIESGRRRVRSWPPSTESWRASGTSSPSTWEDDGEARPHRGGPAVHHGEVRAGISLGKKLEKMSVRASETVGVEKIGGILSEIRVMTAALSVGLARAAYAAALAYARARHAFGKPIAEHQASPSRSPICSPRSTPPAS